MAETKENLKDLDLVFPAKKLYDTLVESAEADKTSDITPDRVKILRLVLGFQNSVINSLKAKTGFFKLEQIDEKLKAIKERTEQIK